MTVLILFFLLLGCPKGTYGRNCMFNCTCSENSVCNNKTGECRCHVGWIGSKCEHGKPPLSPAGGDIFCRQALKK